MNSIRVEKQDGIYYYSEVTGQLHRENGPAIEYSNGTKGWYINGVLHREDGPARITHNGDMRWYKNGSLEKVIYADGDSLYFKDNRLHREDGPAWNMNNVKRWWYKGEYAPVSSQEEFEKYLTLKAFW